MKIRYCDYCGEEYLAKRSNSKFCSNSCRTQNHLSKDKNYELLNAKNGIDFQIKKANVKGMQYACKQINKKLSELGYDLTFSVFKDDEKGFIVLLDE